MFKDDFFLKFQGFHPADFTRSYLTHKMNALRDEAPYGATLSATFTRHHHDFRGVVLIHSAAGKFVAVASGAQLKAVTHKLMEQMRKQLGRWKSNRFHSQAGGRHDSSSVA